MLINKLGEFGLIERFRKSIKTDSSVVRGSGDDCAVIAFNKNEHLLLTCDMIAEGVDFTKKTDPYLIGRKAVAVSISDIAACGGVPRYLVASLGLPRKTDVAYADALFKGARDLAAEYHINIVGGDISKADKLVIDVSMLGVVKKKQLVLRSGAREKDIICVTGRLGGSIRGKHLRFTPRFKESQVLVKNYKINSMIDISDGLIQDLRHILEGSKVGAFIYEDLVPISKDARSLDEALYMGEDFELLFTLPRSEVLRLLKSNDPIFQPIGEIASSAQGLRLIDSRGKNKDLKGKGFRHF